MRSERMKMRVTRVKETVMQSDNRQRSVNMERFTFHDYKPHRVWVWVWTENWWYTSNSFLSVHHWQLSQVYKNVNYIIFFDILLMFCTDNIDSSVQIILGAQFFFFVHYLLLREYKKLTHLHTFFFFHGALFFEWFLKGEWGKTAVFRCIKLIHPERFSVVTSSSKASTIYMQWIMEKLCMYVS